MAQPLMALLLVLEQHTGYDEHLDVLMSWMSVSTGPLCNGLTSDRLMTAQCEVDQQHDTPKHQFECKVITCVNC